MNFELNAYCRGRRQHLQLFVWSLVVLLPVAISIDVVCTNQLPVGVNKVFQILGSLASRSASKPIRDDSLKINERAWSLVSRCWL